MSRAILCREMGWTHDEYQRQPTAFVAMLLGLMNAEAKQRARQNKSQ